MSIWQRMHKVTRLFGYTGRDDGPPAPINLADIEVLGDTKTRILSQQEYARAGEPPVAYADVLRKRMNVAQVALEW